MHPPIVGRPRTADERATLGTGLRFPWRDPLEPPGVHGQRAVSEADRRWRADALEARVCADEDGVRESPLVRPKTVP